MKKRRILFGVALFSALFILAYYLSDRFSRFLHGGTDMPLYMWTIVVWPIVCLAAGGIAGFAFETSFRRPMRMVAAGGTAFATVYGVSILIHECLHAGTFGFMGLLAFHGTDAAGPSGIAFFACPFLILSGLLAEASLATWRSKKFEAASAK